MEADRLKTGKTKRRPMITVLDKMIAQDLLKTLMSVWSVIVAIIVSREFIRVLDKAVQGQIASDTLLIMLGLKTISISVALLPPALFMAVLMVLGRMYRDQEMSAVFAAGGGAGTIYRAVFLLIFPVCLFTLWLSFYAAPWAEAKMDKIINQGKESSDLRGIAAGKFSEYSQGDLVFYVEKISSDKKMHHVFVQQRQKGKQGVISADSARVQELPDGRYIIFEQGERVQGHPGDLNYVIEQFNEYAVRIEEKEAASIFNRAAGTAVERLWNSTAIHDVAELQRRLSIPLSILLLGFIGVPLAQISPRGGVYGNIVMGFLIYFSYGNFIRLSQVWVIKGAIPVWLGGFGVNSLLFLIGCVLLARLYGWQWLMMKIREKVAV
ncbi:MAG: LPS export ABC transporter permease LptF [Methylococcaceae bacterium]